MPRRIIIICLLTCLIIFMILYKLYIDRNKKYYPSIQVKMANINKYYIYGQHFNLEGFLNDINIKNIHDVSLVLKTEMTETYINTLHEFSDNGINFKMTDKINRGLNLDTIDIGDYYLLLKVHYNNNQVEYYSLANATNFGDLDYYTISHNGTTNYITLKFLEPIIGDKQLSFLNINVTNIKVPDHIYDIVIDPGHGGLDSGAVKNNIHESHIVLAIGLETKKEFEKAGIKVKLTREGDYNPGGKGIDPYLPSGRVNIGNNVKAKYLFSIHLNSAPYNMRKGGVEIYCPPNINFDLAKSIASNIVKYAKTRYSPNHLNKIDDGIYVRTFNKEEINETKQEAINRHHEPYPITLDTPYHYIIRETGGIVTNAYIDGRYRKYHHNLYYNHNIGIESYLIELGFMVNSFDLSNMVHNKKGYVLGITEGIKNYLINDHH
ncbi:MAG: N-acetylmuramoyl-L-alanine amidase family protein [Bacilli bacterium]|jgi:N-acetylmuramoyl-L-alanine amidase